MVMDMKDVLRLSRPEPPLEPAERTAQTFVVATTAAYVMPLAALPGCMGPRCHNHRNGRYYPLGKVAGKWRVARL